MTIVLHVLASFALYRGLFVTDLPLWSPLREWLASRSKTFNEMALCPLCAGFWCSLVLTLLQRPESFSSGALEALAGAAGVFLVQTAVLRSE